METEDICVVIQNESKLNLRQCRKKRGKFGKLNIFEPFTFYQETICNGR